MRAAIWRDRSGGPRGAFGVMGRYSRGRGFRGQETVVVRGGRREIMFLEESDGLGGYIEGKEDMENKGEEKIGSTEGHYLDEDNLEIESSKVDSLESGKDFQ